MVYEYVVTLKNQNKKSVDSISLLLCLISVVFFSYYLSRHENWIDTTTGMILLCTSLLTVAVVSINILFLRRRGRETYFNKALLLSGVGWIALPNMAIVGIFLIAMAFIEKPAKSNLEIGFSSDRIVMNSLFRRRFNWSDFNNILLKDDLLTMDFKNNRLLQRPTIDEDSDASEDEFNEYCREQLSRSLR